MAKVILVADDQEACRKINTGVLEGAGYSVHAVNSGEEASAALRSDMDFYGAVLDNNMSPGDMGLQILMDMRTGEYGEGRKMMPVLVVCSGLGKEENDLVRRLSAEYLDKDSMEPISYGEAVRRVFGQ